MRPQVLSYLLVAVTTAAWLETRDDGRARWWLVPLTWVWAMCPRHVAGRHRHRAGRRRRHRPGPRRAARQWLLSSPPSRCCLRRRRGPDSGGSGPVPRRASGGLTRPVLRRVAASGLHATHAVALLSCSRVVLLRMLRRRTAVSWTELLLVVLAGRLGRSTRTGPSMVAAMMLVPLAAPAYSDGAAASAHAGARERSRVAGRRRGCLAALARRSSPGRPTDRPPTRVVPTLDDLPAGTAVLNDWGEGGWLMWRWPDLNFVMNGYGDIFTDAELARNYQLDAHELRLGGERARRPAPVRPAPTRLEADLRPGRARGLDACCTAATSWCCSTATARLAGPLRRLNRPDRAVRG